MQRPRVQSLLPVTEIGLIVILGGAFLLVVGLSLLHIVLEALYPSHEGPPDVFALLEMDDQPGSITLVDSDSSATLVDEEEEDSELGVTEQQARAERIEQPYHVYV